MTCNYIIFNELHVIIIEKQKVNNIFNEHGKCYNNIIFLSSFIQFKNLLM